MSSIQFSSFDTTLSMNLVFRAPQIKVSDKVMIPQDQHPDINFVGLLIGPRGNTLKSMEKETGARVSRWKCLQPMVLIWCLL